MHINIDVFTECGRCHQPVHKTEEEAQKCIRENRLPEEKLV